MIKKIGILITLILLTSLVLFGCNKTSSHSLKNINNIEILDINKEVLVVIDKDLEKDFIKELNSMTYTNHSGTVGDDISYYIQINYKDMTTKITYSTTVNIKDDFKVRNRNRFYGVETFNTFIEKYLETDKEG